MPEWSERTPPLPGVDPGSTEVRTDATYTVVQVGHALNRAADDILDATDAGDEGLRDAINLMVNATACYLTGDAGDLETVVAQGYNAELPEVLGWIAQGRAVITEITLPAYSEEGHEITWDLIDLRQHCAGLIKDGAETKAEAALAWIAVCLIDKIQEMSL